LTLYSRKAVGDRADRRYKKNEERILKSISPERNILFFMNW
jgi:hypothetical protein